MEHRFDLAARNRGTLTGVEKVVSFDPDEVILLLEDSTLTIKGREMHVTRLDVEKGELEFEGNIEEFRYSQKKSVTAAGIVGRLFK